MTGSANLTAGSSAAYPVTIDEDVTSSVATNLTTLAPSVSPQSTSLHISPLASSSTFIASGAPSKSPRASNADLPGFVAPAASSSAAYPLAADKDAAALDEDGVIELAPRMRSGFTALPSLNSVLPVPSLTRTAAAKPLQPPDYPSDRPPNIHVIMLVRKSSVQMKNKKSKDWSDQHKYWHEQLSAVANGLASVWQREYHASSCELPCRCQIKFSQVTLVGVSSNVNLATSDHISVHDLRTALGSSVADDVYLLSCNYDGAFTNISGYMQFLQQLPAHRPFHHMIWWSETKHRMFNRADILDAANPNVSNKSEVNELKALFGIAVKFALGKTLTGLALASNRQLLGHRRNTKIPTSISTATVSSVGPTASVFPLLSLNPSVEVVPVIPAVPAVPAVPGTLKRQSGDSDMEVPQAYRKSRQTVGDDKSRVHIGYEKKRTAYMPALEVMGGMQCPCCKETFASILEVRSVSLLACTILC
jgi:hypothetical protein